LAQVVSKLTIEDLPITATDEEMKKPHENSDVCIPKVLKRFLDCFTAWDYWQTVNTPTHWMN
jgi:hypothetical protein